MTEEIAGISLILLLSFCMMEAMMRISCILEALASLR